MPLTKTMDIKFPSAGVIRRGGLRAGANGQGSFPTPWSTNVRLEDSLTNRLRGGSFTCPASPAKASPVYRDRAITFSGNAVTAARQGNAADTTLSADISDSARPILFQLSEAGDVGGDIVAVVPHKDSYLLCFTASQTWVLSGDPATGSLRRVSDEVGIVGVSAFAVSHDTVYFLSSLGLYMVSADGGGLSPVSEDRVPEELTGVTDEDTLLDYNHADRGLSIHIPLAGVNWFYDTAREGFWPFTTVRRDSHVALGPFWLGRPDSFGRVLTLHGNIASGSADVTWRIVIGDTAEDAAANAKAAIQAAVDGGVFTSYVSADGTWSAGRAHRAYPRTRAIWCCLWLSSAGDWAFEECTLIASLSGKWR